MGRPGASSPHGKQLSAQRPPLTEVAQRTRPQSSIGTDSTADIEVEYTSSSIANGASGGGHGIGSTSQRGRRGRGTERDVAGTKGQAAPPQRRCVSLLTAPTLVPRVATYQLMLQLVRAWCYSVLLVGRVASHRFVLGPLRPPVAAQNPFEAGGPLFPFFLVHSAATARHHPPSPATLPIRALKCNASIGALVPSAPDPHYSDRTGGPRPFRPGRHCSQSAVQSSPCALPQPPLHFHSAAAMPMPKFPVR